MTAIDLMLLTGEWLLYLLAFILAVRPIVKHEKRLKALFKYRKQMGWAFGALTMLHVAVYLFLYIDHLSFVLTLFDDLWFITGLIATVLTLALTATSNKWAQRKLKAKWKTLHKATYYIGFLGIIHGELASKQTNEVLLYNAWNIPTASPMEIQERWNASDHSGPRVLSGTSRGYYSSSNYSTGRCSN